MPKDPLISVVIPVFNTEPYVARAIRSILEQTWPDFELLLIDDGSTDASVTVMEQTIRGDERARVIQRPHAGYVRAINFGLSITRGKYLARMDADDISHPERFERQVVAMEARPGCAALGGAIRLFCREGEPRLTIIHPVDDAAIRSQLRIRSPFAHPAMMLRTAALVDAGGYRPVFEPAEDYDLWLRLSEKHTLANLREVVLDYRVHDRQVSQLAIEQQVLSALGALAAASLRTAGKLEPPLPERIDLAALAALGADPRAADRALVDAYLNRYELMLTLGLEPRATEIEGVMRSRARELGLSARARSGVEWVLAYRAITQRRWLTALRHLGGSLLNRPATARRLAHAIRSRVATGDSIDPSA